MFRVKELREDNDYKQQYIADYLGIRQNSYSQIENEKNLTQVDHLIKLSQFYHTSVDYILGITDEIKPYPKGKYFKNSKKRDKFKHTV